VARAPKNAFAIRAGRQAQGEKESLALPALSCRTVLRAATPKGQPSNPFFWEFGIPPKVEKWSGSP
jgi:hypothetical protein